MFKEKYDCSSPWIHFTLSLFFDGSIRLQDIYYHKIIPFSFHWDLKIYLIPTWINQRYTVSLTAKKNSIYPVKNVGLKLPAFWCLQWALCFFQFPSCRFNLIEAEKSLYKFWWIQSCKNHFPNFFPNHDLIDYRYFQSSSFPSVLHISFSLTLQPFPSN